MLRKNCLTLMCFILSLSIMLTGCSKSSDVTSTQNNVALEDKYSEISLRLANLREIAESHVKDIIKCAHSCPPDDPDFKYSDEFFMPTPVLTEPVYTVVTASYSGYDWTRNQGIIILNVSNEDGTITASIRAFFDDTDTLIDAAVVNVYEVTYSTLDPVVPAAPIIGGDE